MLIAPKRDKEWPDPAAAEQVILTWERQAGLSLPADYRRFLIRFDGGHPHPNIFDSAIVRAGIVPSTEPTMFADYFYGFDEALGHWRGETYGAGTPPGMFFVAMDPGGTEILLSLRPQDFGTVQLWHHSTNSWGSDGNDERALIRQAESFNAFLAGLFDTPDRPGHDFWYRPARAARAREFELPL